MRRQSTPRSEAMTFVEVCHNYGAIAQLGERLICIQEVRGSIPRSSTTVSSKAAKSTSLDYQVCC